MTESYQTMNEAHFGNTVDNSSPPVTTRAPRRKTVKNITKRNGIWYFHKYVKGKREFLGRKTPFSLETSDLEVAKAKRDALLKAANGAEVDRVLNRTSRRAAAIGEIVKAYTLAPTVRANAATRARNIGDLERMVRLVKGESFDARKASSELLTKQLVKDWQSARLAAAAQTYAADLARLEAAKRSLNSLLTHVQSLFSAEARDDYGALYLPPNLAEFAIALPIAARKSEEPVQLTDPFVSGLLGAASSLLLADPAAWVAFQLMTWGGLRNKEAFHARKNWLEAIPVAAGLDGKTPPPAAYRLSMKPTKDFLPKGNSRAVILPALIAEAILALQPAKDPTTGEQDDHLVPAAHDSDRHDAVYRRLNAWLKSMGVNEEAGKLAYRLRKYFLSKVAEQQGIMFAQVAAGHSSRRTLEENYIGKPKMTAPITLATITPISAAG